MRTLACSAFVAALVVAVPAWADAPSGGANALAQTRPIFEIRTRFEGVDQDGMAENASALTMRGHLGFETGKLLGTALLAEGEFVAPLQGHYNSTTNGRSQYPVVADPRTHEINRLQLTNESLPATTIVVGRQRIVLDDQRFVANVGWRQNEQTYDSVRVTTHPSARLTLDAAWISQVNRVFGTESPVGRYDGDSYVLNAGYKFPVGTLTGFVYSLDFNQAPRDSTRTGGFRFAGSHKTHAAVVSYSASWARQNDRGRNPLDLALDYYAFELAGTVRAVTFTAGEEVLEGNGVQGFATPLATLHKFQGWADKFLTTPPDGVVDRYAALAYTTKHVVWLESVTLSVVAHEFLADRGSRNYGDETDLLLEGKRGKVKASLKAADYDAHRLATDTRKYWAQVEYVW